MIPTLMIYHYLLMIWVVDEEEEVDMALDVEGGMVVEVAEEIDADREEDIIPRQDYLLEQ